MLTLLLDETGRGIGRSDATGVPGYTPGPSEVECTPEQYADPLAWMRNANGVLIPAPPLPEPVPAAVSSAQAKIQLMRAEYFEPVKNSVEAIGGEVLIWFTDARTWQRSNPHVLEIGKGLGLSSGEIDALFREAAKIDA